MYPDARSVTCLLERNRQGSAEAMNDLVALIYDDLRRRAHFLRQREKPGHSLETADLVQQGLLRLMRSDEIAQAENRGQLFWAYARAVRRLLIEHARQRKSLKRGGEFQREGLDDILEDVRQTSRLEVLDLHHALDEFARDNPVETRVIEMHFFGGYSLTEIAELLAVSTRTVERHKRFALAWLHARLAAESST